MSSTEMAKTKTTVATTKAEEAFIVAADKCSEISTMSNNALKSLRLARGMADLRLAMDHPEIKDLILGFQGTALGFKTDKKYAPAKVLDCAMEALTAGAHLHGNEFNIIADNTYFAQGFFTRKVREYCTSNKIKRDISYEAKWIKTSGKQSQYEVTATIIWALPGADPRKQIKKYKLLGVSDDQVIGKATKRAHQWLYNELTNNNFIATPDEFFDMPEGDSNTSKPDFESNPNGLEWIVSKHGADLVTQCFRAMNLLEEYEDLDAIELSEERMDLITKNREDFNKQVEEFKQL